MKAKSLLLIAVLAITMIFSAACGSSNSSSKKSSSNSSGSKSSNQNLSGQVVVGGSTALQPLAAAASQEFMKKNSNVQIQVQGGGSGTGLSQVAKGAFNIGMADYFAEAKTGIDASKLVDHKVAVVGMTAAVNPAAGVKNLTKKQLIKVFTGKVTNWKQVGGKNVKITLVNRPDGSGTRATFDQFALDNNTPANGITQDSSNTVKKIVSQTKGAIGYEALSYFTKGDNSIVKMSIDGVAPTVANIANNKFPVWAYEHMYTKGKPNKTSKAFLDYMMSSAVQDKLVPAQGYIPVTKMKVTRDAKGNVTKK